MPENTNRLDEKKLTILERWQITAEELTEIVDANPSMRGNMFGYVAEMKLRKIRFSSERITHSVKYDDHDRKKKGDLVVTYKGYSFIIESKSLQTNSIKYRRQIHRNCSMRCERQAKCYATRRFYGQYDLFARWRI